MIETKELDINLLEAAFYEKDLQLSYSALNKLLTAPMLYYNDYVLKQREDTYGKHLMEGIIIHYLVLENQGFDDKFLVMSDNVPSPTSMQVADEVYKVYKEKLAEDPANENLELFDFEDVILETLITINKHQSLKDTATGTGDSKRIAKIVEPRTEEYFTFLKKKEGRTIIDSATLDKCTRRAEVVKTNPQMRELLGMDLDPDGRNYGVYNELPVDTPQIEGLPFGFKGIIDNMVVDVNNKKILINDFKTTGKSLVSFEESVEFWNYWLQAVMYIRLATSFLAEHIDDTWSIEFRFIVFDKYDQLYAFPVTNETLVEWNERFNKALKEASYHYTERNYSLPYDFIVGNINL